MIFLVLAAIACIVAALWWRSSGGPQRTSAAAVAVRDTSGDDEWARNFEAASERMEHERPDPVDPKESP